MEISQKKLAGIYIALAVLFVTNLLFVKPNELKKSYTYPDGAHHLVLAKSHTRYFDIKTPVYGFLPYWSLANIKYIPTEKIAYISYFSLELKPNGDFDKNASGYTNWKHNEALKNFMNDAMAKGVNFGFTITLHDEEGLDKFLTCKTCWNTATKGIVSELKEHNLQHVNLDFEYPGYTTEEYRNLYSEFVMQVNSEMQKAFDDPYLVISTFADSTIKSRITDVKVLSENSNALFIMSYDFHSATSNNSGPVSPVDGTYSTTSLNLNRMLAEYTKYVPRDKLFLGVPFYGYDWVVETHEPRAARIEGNDQIGYSRAITYEEIKNLMLKKKLTENWDDISKTPFLNYTDSDTGSLRQIYFENPKSIKEKINLVKNNGLLGIGIWALGFDGGYADLWQELD
jgi:spore germination protein